MKTSNKRIIVALIILLAGIYIGFMLKQPEIIEVEKEVDIEIGAEECPTLSQSLKAKCNCPADVYMEVGCVDEIEAENVKIKADKVRLWDTTENKYKIYEVKDVVDSAILETSIIKQ